MPYAAWLSKVDAIAALVSDGMLHDDFDYDWYEAWSWGESPRRAVESARRGVQTG